MSLPTRLSIVSLNGEDQRFVSGDTATATDVSRWEAQISGLGKVERANLELLPFNRQTQKVAPDALRPMSDLLHALSEKAVVPSDRTRLEETRAWVDGLRIVDDLRGNWANLAVNGGEPLSNPDANKMLQFFADHGLSQTDIPEFYSGGGEQARQFDAEIRTMFGPDIPELSKLLNWMAGAVQNEVVANKLRIMATGVLYRDMVGQNNYSDSPGNRGEALWKIVTSVGGNREALKIALEKPVSDLSYLQRCYKELSALPAFADFYDSVYVSPSLTDVR